MSDVSFNDGSGAITCLTLILTMGADQSRVSTMETNDARRTPENVVISKPTLQALHDAIDSDEPARFEAVFSAALTHGVTDSDGDVIKPDSLSHYSLLNRKGENLLCYALNREKLNISKYSYCQK